MMEEIEQVIADMQRDGGAAHPCTRQVGGVHMQYIGLTVRDYFAAAALQGLLANRTFQLWQYDGAEMNAELAARNAYELADAMLKARAAGGKGAGDE